MKLLMGLIIIATLYTYLALKTKAFLDATICESGFIHYGCNVLWLVDSE
jgi:hypothetical protein